jgi:signal transduction histidine kinase
MKKTPVAFKEEASLLVDAPVPFLLIDRTGTVLNAGKAAGVVFSRNGSTLAGAAITDLFEDPSDIFSRIRARRADRRALPCEVSAVLPDGKKVPLTVRLQPLGGKGKQLFAAWLSDRTEVEELKHRLARSEKLSAMAIVAGKVAHEIRSPLNAIFLNNDLLQEKVEKLTGGQGSNLRRYIDILQEEVERLDEVVRSYLSLSRLAGGDREPTSLDSFLKDYIDEVRDDYRHRSGIDFVTAFRTRARRLSLNRRQFRRVLRNLFANSRDAMKNGGVITVSTEERARACRITVSDTGEGIVPEVLSGLATPFTSHKSNGTGLGLYLVREIVEQHRGRFDIRSLRGEGTSVIITLPFPSSRKPS